MLKADTKKDRTEKTPNEDQFEIVAQKIDINITFHALFGSLVYNHFYE